MKLQNKGERLASGEGFGSLGDYVYICIDIAQWTGLTSFQTPAAAVFRRPCTFASLLLIKPDSR